jgi:elongation factor Ts
MKAKPEAAKAKILEGKLNKSLSDIVFLDQKYVKDDKITVAQALADCSKICGAKLTIKDYTYMKVGA